MNGAHFLLIDDHALFRKGLILLLKEGYPEALTSEAESVEEAIRLMIPDPDLILLDVRLPGRRGIDGIGMLRMRWHASPVCMVSALNTEEIMEEALASGASGYISKTERPAVLLEKIQAAVRQESSVPTTAIACPMQTDTPRDRLTARQRDVLQFLCEGLPNKVIAQRLSVSENTIRHHVRDILDYFSANSRSEAAFAARQHGYAE
ncbi:MAG: response regulator transcription factor [Gammaproteobacteria bacterium]|nr:response regulator transcription factor [Gammaproteobacteria bacterium]